MEDREHQARCIDEEPANDLEKALTAVMSGQLSKEEFLRVFLAANVYILVSSEPKGQTLGDCTPLVIAPPAGPGKLMALFSSPIRTFKMTELFSEYRWPVMVNCSWALRVLGGSLGIALNPGCDLGFELAPEGAQELKRAIEQA